MWPVNDDDDSFTTATYVILVKVVLATLNVP